jgi:hypothetical protein
MNSLVQRALNILKTPKTEWPVIAAEPATVQSLYIPYVLVLAAIGPVATLLGGGGFGMFRFSGTVVLRMAVQQYCVSLISVAVLALIVNALAPTFGAQKDNTQAFKTVVYAMTASWVAGIGALIGWLAFPIMIAGLVYTIYLLHLGLPHTMKVPQEKATTYTVVIIVVGILVSWILGAIAAAIFIGSGGNLGMFGAMRGGDTRDEQVLDPDSPLGRLERMGREMERAEKEGRTQDPAQAVGAVMGALTGAGGVPVEALPADTLKAFVPDTLGGLARQSLAAERNAMLGLQVASAKARYGEGERELHLEITDSGGAAGLMALAGWANIEQSSEDGTRTERTGRENGRMVHETWDSAGNRGEYSLVLGNRFLVKVEGEMSSLAELKSAAGELDLARLESLKDQGVKAPQ